MKENVIFGTVMKGPLHGMVINSINIHVKFFIHNKRCQIKFQCVFSSNQWLSLFLILEIYEEKQFYEVFPSFELIYLLPHSFALICLLFVSFCFPFIFQVHCFYKVLMMSDMWIMWFLKQPLTYVLNNFLNCGLVLLPRSPTRCKTPASPAAVNHIIPVSETRMTWFTGAVLVWPEPLWAV